MTSKPLYLRQNVLVEPLINQWYAWTYLISPATAALYITNLHLKIIRSFIANPQIHISALKNPAMIGGPFIAHDSSRVGEIKDLLEKTEKEQAHMLEFAEAVKNLNKLLTTEADGYSLESLYQKISETLKGYVELVYDLNNYPSVRFIEGLLYKSYYYNPYLQSVSLSLVHQDDRIFALSTPRLKEDKCLFLNKAFRHEGLDELFKMRETPQSLGYIKEALGVEDKQEGLFSSFFTEEKPQIYSKHSENVIRIRYFGHACILIESKDISILCDPLISYKYDDYRINRYTIADLPKSIDYVLITHNHQDHCNLESLLSLRYKIKNVIVPRNGGGMLEDPSLKLVLQNIGFNSVREVDEMEEIKIEGGTITGLPFFGEHGDLNIRSKIAYLLKLEGKSILCAADSNNLESKVYTYIHNLYGDLDVLFLGMECDGAPFSWLYGPLLTKSLSRKMDQSRRLNGSNYERAINIAKQLHSKKVYVYAMGQEPWTTHLTSIKYTEESHPILESNKLIEVCRSQGITAERLFGHKEIFLELN
ncbi:MBL fold metallo-hydrolase [Scytonema sp. NUACC26]|uniref:MBL fold metallo-hydrolase n=1 Tax=Scytonema sp. NUACC26 TaxID=3140176 RepID=UPI0034DB8285